MGAHVVMGPRHAPCTKLRVARERANRLNLQVARLLRNREEIEPDPYLATFWQLHVSLDPAHEGVGTNVETQSARTVIPHFLTG